MKERRKHGSFRGKVIDKLRKNWFTTRQIAESIGPDVTLPQVRDVIRSLEGRYNIEDPCLIMERYAKVRKWVNVNERYEMVEDKRVIEYTWSP